MKNYKAFIFCVLTSLMGGVIFAQNQQNTMPTNGNVGIGTTSPTYKLEVNGTARIDSCLIVKDSSTFEKPVHIMDRAIMDEKVVMKDNAVIRKNLRVK